MSKFLNYARSDAKFPQYRGKITDGMFYAELELPFAPHFRTGNELFINRAIPRFDSKLTALLDQSQNRRCRRIKQLLTSNKRGIRF